MKNKIGLIVVLIFAVLQIFNSEKVPFQEPTGADIFAQEEAGEEVQLLVKQVCYNCHSNQVKYPWYASISPLSWWIQDHIDHGREHLNFSEWGTYTAKKKAHKAEEAMEELEEEEMPLGSYITMHGEADLSSEERELLINWFATVEGRYK